MPRRAMDAGALIARPLPVNLQPKQPLNFPSRYRFVTLAFVQRLGGRRGCKITVKCLWRDRIHVSAGRSPQRTPSFLPCTDVLRRPDPALV